MKASAKKENIKVLSNKLCKALDQEYCGGGIKMPCKMMQRIIEARDAEWERMIDDNVWFWNKDGNPRTASQIYKDIQKQITILKARIHSPQSRSDKPTMETDKTSADSPSEQERKFISPANRKGCGKKIGYKHLSGAPAYCGDDVGTHIIYCQSCKARQWSIILKEAKQQW